MIAGPNGSGKTTLLQYIRGPADRDIGYYINPDEIAQSLIGTYDERVQTAQKVADEARDYHLIHGNDFTFETVMSHPSKVEFLERAASLGYNTVLFFISTQSVALNIQRVAQRVGAGGHDVPTDKIVSRFHRSLALLPRALRAASQAYVYDNSDRSGAKLGLSKSSTDSGPYYALHPGAPQWIKTAYRDVLLGRQLQG